MNVNRISLRLVACMAVCLLFLTACQPATSSTGLKTVTVDIVANGDVSTVTLETETQTLREALEERSLITGDDGDYGLFVTTVNGITANSENEEWWRFTKDGEALLTGVDSIMIADGDHYEVTLTVGY